MIFGHRNGGEFIGPVTQARSGEDYWHPIFQAINEEADIFIKGKLLYIAATGAIRMNVVDIDLE